MDRDKIIEKMNECERSGNFNEQVRPPCKKKVKPINESYDYLRKGVIKKVGSFFATKILASASIFFAMNFKLKIIGKENLKGIKKGIIVCNHVHDLDCALIKRALINKNIYYVVSELNNFKGLSGSVLRAAGTLPLSKNISCMKNFSHAIDEIVKKNNFVVFYPEGSLWWCYEKPRPTYIGAYTFAIKNNVPLIPLFFTFKNLKKKKDGSYKKQFLLNIGQPMYGDREKSEYDNKQLLKLKYETWTKEIYERFYNKKLEYLIDNNKKILAEIS